MTTEKLFTAAQQREAERLCAQNGVPLALLMENAGAALARSVQELRGRRLRGVACAVLCGKGGNGGDGFVAARLLRENGASVTALLVCGEPDADTDAGRALARAKAAGVPVLDAQAAPDEARGCVAAAAVVIDAVFGIGFRGALEPGAAALLRAANENGGALRLAADLPSGVYGDEGGACADAFRADRTLAFVARKPAHLLKNTAACVGEVLCPDIGVPAAALDAVAFPLEVLTARRTAALLPQRDPCGHKGTFGRLALLAGCDRYRGAAVLCAKGALAGGAGLVTVCCADKALDSLAAQCPEVILADTRLDPRFFAESVAAAAAVAAGCGLSQVNSARTNLDTVLRETKGTLVLDADGIKLLAENIDILRQLKVPCILTPHPGEFARLTGESVAEVTAHRLEKAAAFAGEFGVTLVLKSENTVVAAPDGRLALCTGGNTGLAKGGSGDLLCGLVASLAASGMFPFDAACAGVWLHARAAELAAREVPERCLTASRVAEALPDAVREAEELAAEL